MPCSESTLYINYILNNQKGGEKWKIVKSESSQYDLSLPGTVTRWATHGPTSGLCRFLQGGRHNFWWKIEVSPQKFNSIISKVPIIVHPGKCLTNILLGFETLHQLNDLKIGHIDLRVLCKVEILLCIANSLYRFIKTTLIRKNKDKDTIYTIGF